jgi:hypothetical protein
MYIYNIVVKWANGDLEGFGASGLTEKSAYDRAVKKAHDKASSFPTNSGFDVLTSAEYRQLTIEQQDDIQLDWNSSTL